MHNVDDGINLPNIAQTLYKDILNVHEYVSTCFNVYVCDLNINHHRKYFQSVVK